MDLLWHDLDIGSIPSRRELWPDACRRVSDQSHIPSPRATVPLIAARRLGFGGSGGYNRLMDRMISGRPALSGRVAAMVALLTLEALAATLLFDGDRPVPDGAWLATAIHVWGASIARFAIAFSVIFATFAFLRHGSALHSIESPEEPIRYSVLGAHIAATVTFFATSRVVYGGRDVPLDANLAGAIWLLSALSFVLTAAVAFIPVPSGRSCSAPPDRSGSMPESPPPPPSGRDTCSVRCGLQPAG